jgi:hypothetical protein
MPDMRSADLDLTVVGPQYRKGNRISLKVQGEQTAGQCG